MRARFCPSLGSLSPSLPHGGMLASLGKVAPAARGNPAGAETLLLEGTLVCLWNLESAPSGTLDSTPVQIRSGKYCGKEQSKRPVVCDLGAERFIRIFQSFLSKAYSSLISFLKICSFWCLLLRLNLTKHNVASVPWSDVWDESSWSMKRSPSLSFWLLVFLEDTVMHSSVEIVARPRVLARDCMSLDCVFTRPPFRNSPY